MADNPRLDAPPEDVVPRQAPAGAGAGAGARAGAATAAPVLVRDLMHSGVVSTTPETSVTEAAAGMVRARVGSAVVMQGSFLAGILTERDVLRAAASAEDLPRSPVSAWMTADPQAVTPAESAGEAAQIMLLNGFRHLPVVEGRTVVGIVSLRDLFAAGIRRSPRK